MCYTVSETDWHDVMLRAWGDYLESTELIFAGMQPAQSPMSYSLREFNQHIVVFEDMAVFSVVL